MKILVLFILAGICQSSTLYNVLKDGDFESTQYWTIAPDSALCTGWCRYSTVWKEPAHSGISFLFARPNTGISAVENLQWPSDSNYNRCDLKFYVRAVSALDTYFKIFWDGTAYSIDWVQWEKDSETTASEWVPVEITLYGLSDTIEFRIQTSERTYISVDSVTTGCYRVEIYENFEFQLFICILVVVLFGTAASFLYRKSDLDFGTMCCCRGSNTVKFIELQDPVWIDVELKQFGAVEKKEEPEAEKVDLTAIASALEGKSNSVHSSSTDSTSIVNT
jgi:hypothetical protein